MPVGIEKISLYAGRLYLDIAELAKVRRKNLKYITNNLMCKKRSVYPAYEDAVTLAVNAAKKLLSPEDIKDIELLIVGTESAVDFGKSVSTWVHRFCNLSANCRNLEVKQACYGSTGGLKMAASWIASGIRPGKKALVINADISRNAIGTKFEHFGGGGAIALLVSHDPQILEIELEKAGYWMNDIYDTFRPTAKVEMINDQISIYSYLDALDGAFDNYEQIVGQVNYKADFKKHIYHAPFPSMPLQAHRTILSKFKEQDEADIFQNCQQKVIESLHFAKQIGAFYGGSNFLCLLSLLNSATNLNPGDRISLFAYGSGCQGEFYSGLIGFTAKEQVRKLNIDQQLNERICLTIQEYEKIVFEREKYIDCSDYEPNRNITSNRAYEKLYEGQEFLVLKQLENYQRRYEWS